MKNVKLPKAPERRIIQIIPAPGWWAVYATDAGREFGIPLVCWVLTEVSSRGGQTEREVVGMDAGGDPNVEFSDECSNFRRYAHAECEADLVLATADDRRAA